MAVTGNRLETALPGTARARSRTRAGSTKPFLTRVLAAVRRSMSVQQARHRRPGPADRGTMAAAWAAGLTRGATLFVDNRRRD